MAASTPRNGRPPGKLDEDLSNSLRGGSEHQVERMAVQLLEPDPRNPRKHGRAQIEAIARSIEAFGFNAPILVDANHRVICGHGRLAAAKLLGQAHVPVIRLSHLSKARAQAYMLADNKLTDRSSWDEGTLAIHLKELTDLAIDFEIEATGFQVPEIDILIQSLEPNDELDEADVFEQSDGPAVTRLGDVWQLGHHRLICGNALDGGTMDRLLGGEKAAAVFTDPPYNVKIQGHAGGKGAKKRREFAMASGEMSEESFTAFLRESFQTIGKSTHRGAVIFVCMDWRHVGELSGAASDAAFQLLNLCVWVKSNGGMGSFYRSQHELIFVFENGGRTQHRNNVQLGRFGRNRTNVWHYPGANSFPRKGRRTGLDFHPTSKPIKLIADAILDATRRSDVILDPFVGAGATILAAERTGRRGFGIEIDPLYVDTAIRRLQAMTGESAKNETGSTFAEVESGQSVK